MKSRVEKLAHPPVEIVAGRLIAVAPALTALLLGVFLVYGAGFAGADVLHAAAHDGRHAFAMPCH